MKFYVASKWERREAVRELMRVLQDKGHTITLDWTIHVDPQDQSVLQEWSLRDVAGVLNCDTYIGLFRTTNVVYYGALVELGVALAAEKRVWIIGNAVDSCIFLLHPLVTKFASIRSMLSTLDKMPRT